MAGNELQDESSKKSFHVRILPKASIFGLKHSIHPRTSLLAVSTFDDIAITDMQRGIGGRLEDAFQSAKERDEAAFVAFVTAGYPRAQGEYIYAGLLAAT